MADEPVKLESCPFCGSDAICVQDWQSHFRVLCLACGALGPPPPQDHKGEDWGAVTRWNTRHAKTT